VSDEPAYAPDVEITLRSKEDRAAAPLERPAPTVMSSFCHMGGSPVGRSRVPDGTPPPTLLPYRCPDVACKKGRWPEGDRCLCCNGAAYVTAEDGEPWLEDGEQLTPAPIPPGVMRNPCPGCALRPGSPERESGNEPPVDAVFWCHKGMEQDEDGNYLPAMAWMGVPIGYLVCRGWWNKATGTGPQPDELEPYREEKLPAGLDPARAPAPQ